MFGLWQKQSDIGHALKNIVAMDGVRGECYLVVDFHVFTSHVLIVYPQAVLHFKVLFMDLP